MAKAIKELKIQLKRLMPLRFSIGGENTDLHVHLLSYTMLVNGQWGEGLRIIKEKSKEIYLPPSV